MDKKFLKELKLEDVVKRFNQINEYTFITSPMLSEDGEEDENQPMDGQNQPPQPQDNMNNGQEPPMPNNQAQGGMMGGNEQQPQPQQPPMGGENQPLPQDSEQPPMDDNEMGEELPDEEMDNDVETEQEGDEVIDIDDLTQSQEASEIKIDGVDNKLTKMLDILNKFSSALEANDKKIDDLRREFEVRNPSEQEKLNIRSQASYPYSETPKDYWDKKTANDSRYNVMYDNDVSTADEQQKFDITTDDVNDFNLNDISKSFDLEDFIKF